MLGLPTDSDLESLEWESQLFIILCYGFILFKAATMIGDGSEKLLLLYGPGIVGGLVIPILGAVPDGAIVLVSGIGSCAQSEVSVGVGTLAGSTIMLLTIPWSFSVFLGYRDVDPDTKKAASDPISHRPKYDNGLTLFNSCVTTYSNTPFSAKIMILTSISYLIVTIPAIIWKGNSNAKSYEHWPAFTGMIVCGLAFIIYSTYQIVDSHAQQEQQLRQQKLKFDQWKHTIGKKFGNTDSAVQAVFNKFDKDGNGKIDRNELYEGFVAMGLDCTRQQIFEIMKDLNQDEDVDNLTLEEFTSAIRKWSRILVPSPTKTNVLSGSMSQKDSEKLQAQHAQQDIDIENEEGPLLENRPQNYEATQHSDQKMNIHDDDDEKQIIKSTSNSKKNNNTGGGSSDDKKQAETLLEQMWHKEGEEEEDDEMYLEKTDRQILVSALGYLLAGTFLVTIFSDPMVDAIEAFSNTIGVSSFYVSFIVTPIASNASEIYSALLFARKKTHESISLSFSTLYGAACMNNTFVLCIFCALVFFRNLQWTFLCETLVILLTIVIVGINGMKDTVKVWQAALIICLFPLSLILVASLDSVLDDTTDETC